MATVSVLYITDDLVGPHLELLRNVCEPFSRSRPHLTVRYFDRLSIPEEYRNRVVTHVDLIEPGAFGLDGKGTGNHTVFIRCKCDELAHLEHKPHFPASEFHITLYDGKSREFAKALLELLQKFNWRIRVQLPPDTKLTQIRVKSRAEKRTDAPRTYNVKVNEIFKQATGENLSTEHLLALSNQERLKVTEMICRDLSRVVHGSQERPKGNNSSNRKRNSRYSRKQATNKHKQDRTKQLKNSNEGEVHLTPPELAREMAAYAMTLFDPESKINFGDPAVGTGGFYAALLQVVPRDRITSAIGIDISPRQVAATRWRWSHHGLQAMVADYLHMDKLRRRNLILANPPYLRHQQIPPKYKHDLRERASEKIGLPVSARSGLYVYFLLLSHEWMKRDAVAAWLIPSEFMQTAYGSVVRNYLTHKVQLLRIHQFGHDDPQFENAMVLPCVIVFRNQAPGERQLAVLTKGGTLANPSTTEFVPIEELRSQSKWFTRSDSIKSAASDIRIGDLFTVRRGIATGANDFFIIERKRAAEFGIPKRALRPLLPKVRALRSDVVETESDGYPRVTPQLCLIDSDLPEAEIKRRYPRFADYLATAAELGILNRNLIRSRHPWYRQERRAPAPFLCTYMGRNRSTTDPPIRFIWNKSAAVVTNTYLMLYPRERLANLLKTDPAITEDVFGLLQNTSRETLSEKWRVHAEGLYKIEPRELLDVRLASNPVWLNKVIDLPKLSKPTLSAHSSEGEPRAALVATGPKKLV